MLGSSIGQINEGLKSLNEKYMRVLSQQEVIMIKLVDKSSGIKFQKEKKVVLDSDTNVSFNEIYSFQFSIVFIISSYQLGFH